MARKKMPPVHPGEILLEDFLKPMRVSQYGLAKALGVPAQRVGDIVHGRRSITADTALRLGRYFGMEAQFWIPPRTPSQRGSTVRSRHAPREAICRLPPADEPERRPANGRSRAP
jgi:antitoxin HigA-1